MDPTQPAPDEPPPPTIRTDGHGGIDPGELLARGLHTPQPSAGAGHWLPPTPEELAALLPQYHIESLLGHGGMGAVYKGIQSELERPVAIKLLPAEMAAEEQFVVRFRREARTLARLQHPGIVAVYDFGQTSQGHLYFVMEFVDGTDLHHIIHRGGGGDKGGGRAGEPSPSLDPAQALALLSQICDALQYAHSQGVIHRDIKPANILLTADGRAKLADFGLARPLQEETAQLTGSHVVMGTMDYMAPEQMMGEADHRSDIFALGVTLYEMLTGRRPRGAFEPPSQRVQVDVRLDEVVVRALQEQPERRYQHASEMRTDVDRIRTTPMEKAEGGARNEESKSRVVAAAIIACLALAGAGGFFFWKKGEPSPGGTRSVVSLTSAGEGGRNVGADGASPSTATKDAPFVNSLGMKFVPVPITGGPADGQRGSPQDTGQPLVPGTATSVLFSVWETRVQDYEVFAKETKREWPTPDFEQGPTHPAVNVSWDAARAFCNWLTDRERKAGKLAANESYRLPSDHEWSCAVGIGDKEDAAKTPVEKSEKMRDAFPWGRGVPPLEKAGNYAGEELRPALAAGRMTYIKDVVSGYRDDFIGTAPVGSFPASQHGLCDLGGNAWEWCEDWDDTNQMLRVLRGGAWSSYGRFLLSSVRFPSAPENIYGGSRGFRCVLELAPSATPAAQ